MGLFKNPFNDCAPDKPVQRKKPNASENLLSLAILLYFLCVIGAALGLHEKYMHYPSLSELHHKSGLLKRHYLTYGKGSSLILEIEPGLYYPVPTTLLPQVDNELLKGKQIDLWFKGEGIIEVWQLSVNGNVIMSRDSTENLTKNRAKWLLRFSLFTFLTGCGALLIRQKLTSGK